MITSSFPYCIEDDNPVGGYGPGALCRPYYVRCAGCLLGSLIPAGIIPAGPAYLLRVLAAAKIAGYVYAIFVVL